MKNAVYAAVSVPKTSREHRLSYCSLTECYVSYWLNENHHVLTPHKFLSESQIVGVASEAPDELKEILIKNNIVLNSWINKPLSNPSVTYDEILIIELPAGEE